MKFTWLFIISIITLIGCGQIPTPMIDDVVNQIENEEEDFVCYEDGFDQLCVQTKGKQETTIIINNHITINNDNTSDVSSDVTSENTSENTSDNANDVSSDVTSENTSENTSDNTNEN